MYLRYRRSNIARSADLDGLVKARIMASFQERLWRDKASDSPKESM